MPEWSETTAQVLKSHGVSEKSGLSASQVARLTAEHGKNELAQEEATPLWKLVLAQFDDLLVKILLGAAVLSFVLACFEEGEGVEAFVEPFVILLILVINAVVGVWQEHNAESALEALKQMQSATAKCIRGGELVPDLPAEELVPGDIVEIGVGDKVPADVASGGATALPRSHTPSHTPSHTLSHRCRRTCASSASRRRRCAPTRAP
jgi:Ca2+-transporting ATPase